MGARTRAKRDVGGGGKGGSKENRQGYRAGCGAGAGSDASFGGSVGGIFKPLSVSVSGGALVASLRVGVLIIETRPETATRGKTAM